MAFITDEQMSAALKQVQADNTDFLENIKNVLSAMQKGAVQAGIKAEADLATAPFLKDMLKNGKEADFTIQYDSKDLDYKAERTVSAYIKWLTNAENVVEMSSDGKHTRVFLDANMTHLKNGEKVETILESVNNLIKDGKYDAVKVAEFAKNHPDLVSNEKQQSDLAKVEVPQVADQRGHNVQLG